MMMLIFDRGSRHTTTSFYVTSAKTLFVLSALTFLLMFPNPTATGKDKEPCDGTEYRHYRSGKDETSVCVPNGDVSFADEAEWYQEGSSSPDHSCPDPTIPEARGSCAATGVPNYEGKNDAIISVGLRGSLIVRFTNNSLMDYEGEDDLYIFEIGRDEPTCVYVSEDKKEWITIGKIDKVKIDIGCSNKKECDYHSDECDLHAVSKEFTKSQRSVETGVGYHYVLLQDIGVSSIRAGIDIDAVAAIGGLPESEPYSPLVWVLIAAVPSLTLLVYLARNWKVRPKEELPKTLPTTTFRPKQDRGRQKVERASDAPDMHGLAIRLSPDRGIQRVVPDRHKPSEGKA